MLKEILELDNVQELTKNTQRNIAGGDSFFYGVPCEKDSDCCDDTAEGFFAGSKCISGISGSICQPVGL